MKIRLALRITVAFAVLLAACSCHKEEARGGGVVSFRFSTGALATRATTPGDGVVADGGGIYISDGKPDLVILIATTGGDIIRRYDGTAQTADEDIVLQSLTATEAVVAFDMSDQEAGDYLVYAFANGLSTLTQSIGSVSDLEALTLTVLPDGMIPLSAKGAFTVYEEMNGQVSLELIRCVAKVSVELVNNTGEDLVLTDFTEVFSGMGPDRGFVLEQDALTPAGTVSGDLVAGVESIRVPGFDTDGTSPGRLVAGSWYVFPSAGPYTSTVSFTLGGKDYSYPDLSVTDNRQQDILSLVRNQHLRVVTRISRGHVSFNFEVADWEEKNEEVQFD